MACPPPSPPFTGQIFSPSPHWGLIHSWNGFLGYFYLYSPCTKQSVASAPPQTCDNIWTTRPSQAPQEAPRRCQGAPQAPWWGGGLSCGAPSPIIWTAAADRRMPLTCLCRFYSSINVCFRFQDQNGQKISWRMWPHIWPTKGGGDMKQGGRQGSIREGIFNLVTRRLVGFMGEMKRGKTRLLPDNWN